MKNNIFPFHLNENASNAIAMFSNGDITYANTAFEKLYNPLKKDDKNQADYERVVELYKLIASEEKLIKSTKKHMKQTKKVEYVKRDAVKKIIAAWVITVPAAATLAAVLFFMIKGIMV